jgi:N-methylhydantoinase B
VEDWSVNPPKPDIDLMLVSVLQNRFKSITEEMGLTLLRTTRSPILNEARDFVTGLYDAEGKMLEQTEYIPILAFALQPVCEHIVERFRGNIHPGDVFIHNDVFTGGNQNADVALFKPVFAEGRLVGWAACKGHQADIGGNVLGGYNPDAREVWQEAFRIPPVKIYERGKLRKDVWDLIFANIRLKTVEEDIRAHIGACVVGERGLEGLAGKYGVDALKAHIDFLFDATEQRMLKEIHDLPNGESSAVSYIFGDGIDESSRHAIRVKVTIGDDHVTYDYTGTDPQTRGFANAPLSSTRSAVMLCTLMIVDPYLPHNDGLLRPIRTIVPEGCFLNAQFPAATTFGNTIAGPNSDAIFRAFAQLVPDRVTAGWNRAMNAAISGYDSRKGRQWADIFFISLKGGSGAIEGTDGYDHIGLINCAGGILAQDYEMMEVQDPIFLLRHEYLCDSAGAGRFRGGLGVVTEFRVLGDRTKLVAFGDGIAPGSEAFGLAGGLPGCLNELVLRYPDGSTRVAISKEIISEIPAGTVIRQVAGGGGGFGPPLDRQREKVIAEVEEGLLSLTAARSQYGLAEVGE